MAKYAIFTPELFETDEKTTGVIIYVETPDGIRQYSEDSEEDELFFEFSKRQKQMKDGFKNFEDFLTGFTYYRGEVGEYSGEAKKKVDAAIAKLKRGKVKIVEA